MLTLPKNECPALCWTNQQPFALLVAQEQFNTAVIVTETYPLRAGTTVVIFMSPTEDKRERNTDRDHSLSGPFRGVRQTSYNTGAHDLCTQLSRPEHPLQFGRRPTYIIFTPAGIAGSGPTVTTSGNRRTLCPAALTSYISALDSTNPHRSEAPPRDRPLPRASTVPIAV
jgi:hypothetical protein